MIKTGGLARFGYAEYGVDGSRDGQGLWQHATNALGEYAVQVYGCSRVQGSSEGASCLLVAFSRPLDVAEAEQVMLLGFPSWVVRAMEYCEEGADEVAWVSAMQASIVRRSGSSVGGRFGVPFISPMTPHFTVHMECADQWYVTKIVAGAAIAKMSSDTGACTIYTVEVHCGDSVWSCLGQYHDRAEDMDTDTRVLFFRGPGMDDFMQFTNAWEAAVTERSGRSVVTE
jgi:hypothetical protein